MGVKELDRHQNHRAGRRGCHQGGSGRGGLVKLHRQESGLTWDSHV